MILRYHTKLSFLQADDTSTIGQSILSEKKEAKHVSLDKFLRTHTSEDNESFYELMEESKADFQLTHAWMFKKDEQLSIENKNNQLALPSLEMQAAGSDLKMSKPLDGWTYKNVNAVFYHPDGAAFSDAEKIEMAKKEKIIVHENTRFTANPWKTNVSDSSLKLTATLKKEANMGKVGVDGKELIDPTTTPSLNGYSLLRISDPSPMIDPGESPLMTWGEVESTPYRLEGCETPMPVYTGDGPSFKIQDVPKRDRLAHQLAEKNSKFYRDKKTKAIQQARSNIKTPKSVASLSTRVATMSPAAQRLATSKLGIRLGTDKALKASYTPSPMRSSLKEATPKMSARSNISTSVRLTPKGSATPSTPTFSTRNVDTTTLTDNLLNLPSSSKQRPRASDFL
jgi:protein DGCR14